MSDTIDELLHEVADAVEPGDRLDAIRAATADVRRPHRGWWAAGGAGLAAAAVVAAFALTGTQPTSTEQPGPAGASTSPTSLDTSTSPTAASTVATRTVPVYFIGDTPAGPRLYREFQAGTGPMSAETFALDAALSGAARDPDYRSSWPAGAVSGAYSMTEDLITVTLEGDLRDRPAGMSEAEAGLAIEQVVRTAQGLFGHGRVPVQLFLNDARTDQVLGVPASEPLTAGPDLDVLAHVSLSQPSEGSTVRAGEAIPVVGVAVSETGRVSVRITRRGDADPSAYLEPDLEPSSAPLAPFSVKVFRDDLEPGDYDVAVTVTSSDGTVHTDTRRITIVD